MERFIPFNKDCINNCDNLVNNFRNIELFIYPQSIQSVLQSEVAMVKRDRLYVNEIIIIATIILMLLGTLGVTKSPSGGQQINVGQIGLPEKAVQELKNLLKP